MLLSLTSSSSCFPELPGNYPRTGWKGSGASSASQKSLQKGTGSLFHTKKNQTQLWRSSILLLCEPVTPGYYKILGFLILGPTFIKKKKRTWGKCENHRVLTEFLWKALLKHHQKCSSIWHWFRGEEEEKFTERTKNSQQWEGSQSPKKDFNPSKPWKHLNPITSFIVEIEFKRTRPKTYQCDQKSKLFHFWMIMYS